MENWSLLEVKFNSQVSLNKLLHAIRLENVAWECVYPCKLLVVVVVVYFLCVWWCICLWVCVGKGEGGGLVVDSINFDETAIPESVIFL